MYCFPVSMALCALGTVYCEIMDRFFYFSDSVLKKSVAYKFYAHVHKNMNDRQKKRIAYHQTCSFMFKMHQNRYSARISSEPTLTPWQVVMESLPICLRLRSLAF